MSTHPIFTIGYGTRPLPQFIDTLQSHGVAYLIDVRSQPYSRYKPEFSKKALAAALKKAGIQYVFMGHNLGGRQLQQRQSGLCEAGDTAVLSGRHRPPAKSTSAGSGGCHHVC